MPIYLSGVICLIKHSLDSIHTKFFFLVGQYVGKYMLHFHPCDILKITLKQGKI